MAYPHKRNVQPFEFLELKQLPRLPVLSLDETLKRYLHYLQPLLESDDERRRLERSVADSRAELAALQEELLQLNAHSPTSFLEGFWDSWYLAPRCPLPINVNPGFLFRDDGSSSQIRRATWMIHASCLYYSSIRAGSVPMETARGQQLCMTQYGRFFATYREPRIDRDEILTFTDSRHIVVICRNQYFSVTVLEENFAPLPQATIARSLQEIKRLSMEYEAIDTSWKYPVGCLTAMERNAWAKARAALIAYDKVNLDTLTAIDSALLLLCLDDDEPHNLTEFSEQLLHHDDGTNRWFDKTSLIISGNGKAGVNMEHSAIDGHTMLSYLDYMYNYAKERAHEKIPSSYYTPSAVKPLQWKLSPALKDTVYSARVAFKAFAASMQVQVVEVKNFGEEAIRKLGVGADAFVQMAFQLAWYRMKEGKPASTYESCQTKAFYHGRTECIRAVTPESHAFATYMSGTPSQDSAKAAALLRAAIGAHRDRTKECSLGRGVDRHLFALKNLAESRRHRLPGYIMPPIFEDPCYSRLMTSVLSTSNCGSKAVELFTFGPVTDVGLGLGYIVHRTGLQVSVTSFVGEAKLFAKLLEKSLNDMKTILDENKQAKI